MKTAENGISLHSFPMDRPAILRQWISFVNVTRKNWSGPTKHSLLCSLHFKEDCFPAKYRIMDSIGVKYRKRDLEKDAVPTIQAETSSPIGMSPLLGDKRKLHTDSPLSSTPKRPRRAFQKREADRVRLECEFFYCFLGL
jgi:hypothetical protein